MPLAVDDAHAAFAVMQAEGEKASQLVSRFITIQAMQIDFALRDPAPSAQIAQHVLGDAVRR